MGPASLHATRPGGVAVVAAGDRGRPGLRDGLHVQFSAEVVRRDLLQLVPRPRRMVSGSVAVRVADHVPGDLRAGRHLPGRAPDPCAKPGSGQRIGRHGLRLEHPGHDRRRRGGGFRAHPEPRRVEHGDRRGRARTRAGVDRRDDGRHAIPQGTGGARAADARRSAVDAGLQPELGRAPDEQRRLHEPLRRQQEERVGRVREDDLREQRRRLRRGRDHRDRLRRRPAGVRQPLPLGQRQDRGLDGGRSRDSVDVRPPAAAAARRPAKKS